MSTLHSKQIPCRYYSFDNFEVKPWKCYGTTFNTFSKADKTFVQRRNIDLKKKFPVELSMLL